MTYARSPLHLPQRLQFASKNFMVARLCSSKGPIPFSGVSLRRSRNSAPMPRLRHRFGPSISGIVFPSAIISAISSTCISSPRTSASPESNTANAIKPEDHAVPVLPKDAWGLLFLVKNPSHDCRSEMK